MFQSRPLYISIHLSIYLSICKSLSISLSPSLFISFNLSFFLTVWLHFPSLSPLQPSISLPYSHFICIETLRSVQNTLHVPYQHFYIISMVHFIPFHWVLSSPLYHRYPYLVTQREGRAAQRGIVNTPRHWWRSWDRCPVSKTPKIILRWGETDRQTSRQVDRQTDRQTDRRTDR